MVTAMLSKPMLIAIKMIKSGKMYFAQVVQLTPAVAKKINNPLDVGVIILVSPLPIKNAKTVV